MAQERASLDRQRLNLKAKLRQASETESDVKYLQGENKQLTRSLGEATAEVSVTSQRDKENPANLNLVSHRLRAQLLPARIALGAKVAAGHGKAVGRQRVCQLLSTMSPFLDNALTQLSKRQNCPAGRQGPRAGGGASAARRVAGDAGRAAQGGRIGQAWGRRRADIIAQATCALR